MASSSYHERFAFLQLPETDSSGRPRLPGCAATIEPSTLKKLLEVELSSTDGAVQNDNESPEIPAQEATPLPLGDDEYKSSTSKPQSESTQDLVEHMLIHSLRDAEDRLGARLDEIEGHGLVLNEIWGAEKKKLERERRGLDDRQAELNQKINEHEKETLELEAAKQDLRNEKMALLKSKQIAHNIQNNCVRQLKALDEKAQVLKTRELKLKEETDKFERARNPGKRELLRTLIEGITNKDELTAVLHLTLRRLADERNTVADIFGVAIDRIILPQILRHPTRQMSWDMFQNYVISPMRAKLYPAPHHSPAAGPLNPGSGLVVPKSLAGEPAIPLTTVHEHEPEPETENITRAEASEES